MTKLNYTITKIRKDEVEISFESWDSRYPIIWRIVLKENRLEIAKPGRCNNFELSYSWIFTVPLYGYGIKKISEIISEHLPKQYLPDSPNEKAVILYNAHKDYIKQVSGIIVKVRSMLTI